MRDPNPKPTPWDNFFNRLERIILEQTCVYWGNSTLIPSELLVLKKFLELAKKYNSPSQQKTLSANTILSQGNIKNLILRLKKHLGQISGDALNNPSNSNYHHSGGRPERHPGL